MPGGSIRLANVDVAFSANTAEFDRSIAQIRTQNASLQRSFLDLSRPVAQFTESIRSSLIATVAYSAGVGAIIGGTNRAATAFLDFETGLTAVRKTANLSGFEIEGLAQNINTILTERSALGGPLPIMRNQLLQILDVAGQMNITGVRDLTRFGEAVGLLTLTTDLQGRAAADALGIVIANTRALASESLGLASALTQLGNVNRGGERGIIAVAERLAQGASRFNLAAEDLLAVAATATHVGLQPELSGTAFQRSLQELQNAANAALQGDDTVLREIARNLVDDTTTIEEQIASLLETIQEGDFATAFRTLLRSFREAGPQQQGGLRTALFGGDPQRLGAFLGSLALQQERLGRNTQYAYEEMQTQNAILREAGLFAENAGARLQVVGNQIEQQLTGFGGLLVGAFVPVAENFRAIEAGLAGIGAALISAFGNRQLQRMRQVNAAGRELAQTQHDNAAEAIAAREATLQTSRQNQDTYRREQQALERQQQARQNISNAERRINSTRIREGIAVANLEQANNRRLVNHARLLNADLTPAQAAAASAARERADADARRQNQIIRDTRREIAAQERVIAANRRVALTTVQTTISAAENRRELENSARTEQNLIRDRQTHAQALQVLTRRTDLWARSVRGLRRAFDFIGGVPGLLITVGSIAATVLANTSRSTRDARQEISDALREIREETRRAEREAAGLTPLGLNVETAEAEATRLRGIIASLEQELRDAVEQPDVGIQTAFGAEVSDTAIRSARDIAQQLTDTRTRLTDIEEALSDLRDAQNEVGDAGEDAGNKLSDAFSSTNLNLDTPLQQLRQFREGLRDASELAARQATFDISTAGLPPGELRRQQLIFEEQLQIDQRRVQAARELRDAQEDLGLALQQRNAAVADRQALTASDKNFEIAKNTVAQAERNVQAQRHLVETKQEALDLANAEFLTEQRIAELARQAALERDAETTTARAQFVPRESPNLLGVQRETDAVIQQIQRQVEERQRAAAQEVQIANARNDQIAAGLRAGFDVSNQFIEAQIQASDNLADARRRLADTNRELIRVDQQIQTASDADRDSLIARETQLERTREALVAEVRERVEAVRTLEGQTDAVRDLIAAARDLGELSVQSPLQAYATEIRRNLSDLEAAVDRTRERISLRETIDVFGEALTSARAPIGTFAATAVAELGKVVAVQNLLVDGIRGLSGEFARALTEANYSYRDFFQSLSVQFLDQLIQTVITGNIFDALGIGETTADAAAAQAYATAITTAGTTAAAAVEIAGTSVSGGIATAGTTASTGMSLAIEASSISFTTSMATAGSTVATAIVGAGNAAAAAIAAAAGVQAVAGVLHSGGIGAHPPQRRALSFSPGLARQMLRPGERFAIILDDEEVIPRRDPRHRWNIQSRSMEELRAYIARMPRYHQGRGPQSSAPGGGSVGGGMELTVELINRSPSRLLVQDGGQRIEGGRQIASVIIEDARVNGPITQSMRLAMAQG